MMAEKWELWIHVSFSEIFRERCLGEEIEDQLEKPRFRDLLEETIARWLISSLEITRIRPDTFQRFKGDP